MLWDPTFKPRLRVLEAFPIPADDGPQVGIRDQSALSDVMLAVSEPTLHLLGMMDGESTCEEICAKFRASFGQALSPDTFHSLLEALTQAHFLDGPTFESYYQCRLEDYRQAGARSMPHAQSLGIEGDSRGLFDNMLRGVEPEMPEGTVRGLIAPHLDYPRGEPCYAAAYATLPGQPPPDRVVILGTNHFGRSASVVATASDFATPLGTTPTDVAFLERLESRCGGLRTYELDHVREHSIELQVLWLQYLLGGESFEIVPFLCPDPCGPTGTTPLDGKGVDLSDFARTLGELVDADDRETLLVAGADLSHVGAAFGDERSLDETFLGEVRRRDARVLEQVAANNPTALVQCVARDENVTRVCSAGCIFALATALPQTVGTVLRYHQAVDQASQTCVTCAAVVFT